MEVKILKDLKEELEVELENITISEILRVYLNKDPAVTFVAWKRTHPSNNPILLVKTKAKKAKKAVDEAISSISKELAKLENDFGKLK